MNCKNCGAPLKSHICEYCNTDNKYIHGYSDGRDVIIHFPDKEIKFTVTEMNVIDASDTYLTISEEGKLRRERRCIYEMHLVSESILV